MPAALLKEFKSIAIVADRGLLIAATVAESNVGGSVNMDPVAPAEKCPTA
jgi:hypothetical protein